jgi:hypothetical protein
MHVLLGKLLELVRMEQDPLRVFPRAHFPHRWRGSRTSKTRLCLCKQTPPPISPHTIKTIPRTNDTNKSSGRHKTSDRDFLEKDKHAFGLSQ